MTTKDVYMLEYEIIRICATTSDREEAVKKFDEAMFSLFDIKNYRQLEKHLYFSIGCCLASLFDNVFYHDGNGVKLAYENNDLAFLRYVDPHINDAAALLWNEVERCGLKYYED